MLLELLCVLFFILKMEFVRNEAFILVEPAPRQVGEVRQRPRKVKGFARIALVLTPVILRTVAAFISSFSLWFDRYA